MRDQLPAHIIHLVDEEAKTKSSPRQFCTSIINSSTRGSRMALPLCLDDPMFIEHQQVYNKKYRRAEDTAMPESVMRGLYFHSSAPLCGMPSRKGPSWPSRARMARLSLVIGAEICGWGFRFLGPRAQYVQTVP